MQNFRIGISEIRSVFVVCYFWWGWVGGGAWFILIQNPTKCCIFVTKTQYFITNFNKKDKLKLRTFIQVVQFSGENVKNFSYRIRHLSNSLNCISKSMYPRNSLSFGHFPIAVPYKMRIMSYIYHFMRCPHKLIHCISAMMNLGVMIITFVN